MPSEPDPPGLPERIGPYRVLEEVGRGGMGVVLRAIDPRLGRAVALKLLPPTMGADPEARERFEREARAASALDHPSICTIYEIAETDDGQGYIAMAFYGGATLEARLREGPLPVADVLEVARAVAEGLARAHESHIVHRDIKPSNIILTDRGEVKILDFGVAKLTGEAGLTRTGAPVGTLHYLAPEQASGEAVDGRADLWALGVLLHEMLTGATPFERDTPAATMGAVLAADPEPVGGLRGDTPPQLAQLVSDLLQKDREERPGSADIVVQRLREIQGSLASAGADPPSRRPLWVAALSALLILTLGVGWWATRGPDGRWAREVAIPEVLRLVGENRPSEAAALALEAEEMLGSDPLLEPLWPRMTTPLRIQTDPEGARVSVRPYADSVGEWTGIGETPLELARFPLGATRFRIEREGYEPVELARSFISANQQTEIARAGYDYQNDASYAIDLTLTPTGELPPGMVRVAGGLYATVPLLGFQQISPRMIPEFYIDRTEVTHEDFHAFVKDGGYEAPRWWAAALAEQRSEGSRDGAGRENVPPLSHPEAVLRFVDATGRRGPATWVLGAPPEGLADHPVTGVSWYEAAAYCAWRGDALPTLYHWARATLPSAGAWVPFSPTLAAHSNVGGQGTVPVGSLDAVGISGAQDLVGNAREWTATESATGRFLLGGSWEDPAYSVADASSASPWRRAEGDGFRCARYGPEGLPDDLRAPVVFTAKEMEDRPEMSDEVYEATRAFYTYDADLPLAARTDSTRLHPNGWRIEWVSVQTPYGERLPIRLHIPADASEPLETVVFFPGSNLLLSPTMDEIELVPLDFIPRSGRVLVEPVFAGGFQRNDGRTMERWMSGTGRNELVQRWVQDLGRTLDYIEERPDLAPGATAYLGLSLGAGAAPYLLAFEPRVRAAVLIGGGFSIQSTQEAIDRQSGLAGRVSAPVLLLAGEQDTSSPVEPNKTAFLAAFGAPDSAKILRSYDGAGHWPLPLNEVIRETADFLERYVN